MSLMTFAEVRPWARSIKTRSSRREMPPWHIDRSIGEYSNDPSLSDKEVDTIAAWVDAGAPEGNRADAPAGQSLPAEHRMDLRQPDLIVRMEKGFKIPASGPDFIPEEIVDPGLTEDRYVKWVQIIPDAWKAVHHAHVYVDFPEGTDTSDVGLRHGIERRRLDGPDRVRRRQRCGHFPGRHDEGPEEGIEIPLRRPLSPVRRRTIRPHARRHQVLSERLQAGARRHVASHSHRRRQRLGAESRAR